MQRLYTCSLSSVVHYHYSFVFHMNAFNLTHNLPLGSWFNVLASFYYKWLTHKTMKQSQESKCICVPHPLFFRRNKHMLTFTFIFFTQHLLGRTYPDVFSNLSVLQTFFKYILYWAIFGLLLWETIMVHASLFPLYWTWFEEILQVLNQGLFWTVILGSVIFLNIQLALFGL